MRESKIMGLIEGGREARNWKSESTPILIDS